MTTIYLPTIRNKFSSDNYYQSCKAVVNKVNGHYGWPMDYLPISEFETRHDEIVQLMLDNYTIRNSDQLYSKMSHLYGAMKAAGYKGEFRNRRMAVRQVPVIPKPLVKQTQTWDEMLVRFDQALQECNHIGGHVIALTYKHGYVLRCGEIANTCIEDKEGYNYLDTENLVWHIRAERTKNRTDRSFSVTRAYVEAVKRYIKKGGFLVSKKSGSPYTGNFTLSTVGLSGFTVNDARNAYETMNYARTDIDEEEKNRISVTVLGHCPAVARAFYTPSIDVIDSKPNVRNSGL